MKTVIFSVISNYKPHLSIHTKNDSIIYHLLMTHVYLQSLYFNLVVKYRQKISILKDVDQLKAFSQRTEIEDTNLTLT